MAESLPQIKKQLNELIQLNEELENYFRNTIIPQLFIDADLILRKFSPPAMTQFNLTDNDIGKHIDEVKNNLRFPDLLNHIQEVMDKSDDLEKEVQTTDARWFQMNILPYFINQECKTNGVIITFVDITERIENLKELQHLNDDHESFIYSVSHDLRGPLSSIEGLIQIWNHDMKSVPSSELQNTKELIDRVSTIATSMKTMLSDLSDISKTKTFVSKGAKDISVKEVLKDVLLILKDKIITSGAVITTDLKETHVHALRKNIRSILYNLISNAIKYKASDRLPEIFIATERTGDHFMLSITDNGQGIDEGKKEVLFEKYTRFSEEQEGTGIGLYIVKKLVDNSGGTIEINSIQGKGTTFTIHLIR